MMWSFLRRNWPWLLPLGAICLVAAVPSMRSRILWQMGLTPCSHPPGVSVDGYVSGTLTAWVDLDSDGFVDQEEEPLPGVHYYPSLRPMSVTGADGSAGFYRFKPGCACNCWRDTTIFVDTPPGYSPTTPTEHLLESDDDTPVFGFIPIPGWSPTPTTTPRLRVPHTTDLP